MELLVAVNNCLKRTSHHTKATELGKLGEMGKRTIRWDPNSHQQNENSSSQPTKLLKSPLNKMKFTPIKLHLVIELSSTLQGLNFSTKQNSSNCCSKEKQP
ncbi:hypothetical protein KY285_002644 [Solanum tuberosum]|nr:hypothetical protein KY284_002816 [Solanum tuberosum]KAH0766773.1 hypothetical protein KY285_002644 [Solanum tuberosum]